MRCCDKTRKVATKVSHIVQGLTALATGKKYEFADDRVRVCQQCEYNYWLGRGLFCSICKCFVPMKARVEDEECPRGRWAPTKSSQNKKSVDTKKKLRFSEKLD